MIVIGQKYRFNSVELEKLQRFNIIYVDADIQKIKSLIQKKNIQVIILNIEKVENTFLKELTKLDLKGITFLTINHFLEKYLNKVYIPKDGTYVDFLDRIKPYTKMQFFLKRVVDFSVALPLAVITAPIMLYCVYKIKKESPDGPVIYAQKRVGRNGKEFVCYKFRSMVPNAEKDKPQFAQENDPRIFKWGAFMRRTRIDELPQLWNVLKGDMHFVGPRPERKYWVELFEKEIPFYNERHLVAPGITGWAQVNYPYGSNTEDAYQKLMYDLYYIKHWSLLLEIKTLFKTLSVIISKKGR